MMSITTIDTERPVDRQPTSSNSSQFELGRLSSTRLAAYPTPLGVELEPDRDFVDGPNLPFP